MSIANLIKLAPILKFMSHAREHFFKGKTKKTTQNTLTNRAVISFCTSSFILLLCHFLRLYIFSSFLLPHTFFPEKKNLHAHLFSCFVFLFISTLSFLASLDVYCKAHQVSANIEVYVTSLHFFKQKQKIPHKTY
jgi:hypothetical protein